MTKKQVKRNVFGFLRVLYEIEYETPVWITVDAWINRSRRNSENEMSTWYIEVGVPRVRREERSRMWRLTCFVSETRDESKRTRVRHIVRNDGAYKRLSSSAAVRFTSRDKWQLIHVMTVLIPRACSACVRACVSQLFREKKVIDEK